MCSICCAGITLPSVARSKLSDSLSEKIIIESEKFGRSTMGYEVTYSYTFVIGQQKLRFPTDVEIISTPTDGGLQIVQNSTIRNNSTPSKTQSLVAFGGIVNLMNLFVDGGEEGTNHIIIESFSLSQPIDLSPNKDIAISIQYSDRRESTSKAYPGVKTYNGKIECETKDIVLLPVEMRDFAPAILVNCDLGYKQQYYYFPKGRTFINAEYFIPELWPSPVGKREITKAPNLKLFWKK